MKAVTTALRAKASETVYTGPPPRDNGDGSCSIDMKKLKIKPHDGSTNPLDLRPIDKGFVVGIAPERSYKIPGRKLVYGELASYGYDNRDLLAENPNACIGTWYDEEDDAIYLDVSAVIEDLDSALELARKSGEKAVWDVVANKNVPVE